MQELTDIALLQKYIEHGSEDAFGTLVARHINKVYSVALRYTANPHQAEEITQAVFVILARKSRDLGNRIVLEGWLYETTRLTSLAFLRSETRRIHREQEAYMQSVSNEQESDVWPQIAPLLDTAISRLNKTDRNALILRFFYGKKMKEVGAVLGLSEGATRLRLHRSVEKLRLFFGKRGIVSTSEIVARAISVHATQAAPMDLAKNAAVLALAKAPAASLPTLTLAKGVLKIMTWTKLKTVTITGAALLLAAGTAPIIVKEIQSRARVRPIPHTTAATDGIKGQFFTVDQLVDAGNVTPEAAWESRYWARAKGDYDAVIAGTDPQAIAGAKSWMRDRATFHTRSRRDFASFRGFQILARKDMASDRVELKYSFGFLGDSPSRQTKVVTMVRVDGVWRCAQTRSYDSNWDIGSQPEPES